MTETDKKFEEWAVVEIRSESFSRYEAPRLEAPAQSRSMSADDLADELWGPDDEDDDDYEDRDALL